MGVAWPRRWQSHPQGAKWGWSKPPLRALATPIWLGGGRTTPKGNGGRFNRSVWGWPNHSHGPPKARKKKKRLGFGSRSGVAEPTPRPNGGSRANPMPLGGSFGKPILLLGGGSTEPPPRAMGVAGHPLYFIFYIFHILNFSLFSKFNF
jgi:hypothetical protein